MTALLGCNTNIGLLGSEEQGKSSLCYTQLLKYVTKSNTGIVHSASLILHARRTIERFLAEDSGTSAHTAMHLLYRVTSKISCAVEVSANMAALAILGAPSETISCQFFNVYVNECYLNILFMEVQVIKNIATLIVL